MDYRIKTFLDLIAFSEGTLGKGDNGYNVMVGGSLFYSYVDHPRKLISIPAYGVKSSAAGRYQILKKNYDYYRTLLSLPDFSPASQDAIAIQMIKEQGAYDDILTGQITSAIGKCANIWASFPGANYQQREQKLDTLLRFYVSQLGKYSTTGAA